MALDSYRVRETKRVVEQQKPKTMEDTRIQMQQINDLLRSLPEKDIEVKGNTDIDQSWIKENESRENRFWNTNQNNDDNQPVFQNKSLKQRLDEIQSDIISIQQSYEQQKKEQDTIIEWEEVPQQPQVSPQTQDTIVTYEEIPPQINQMFEQMQQMSNSTNDINKSGRRI